MRKILFLSLFSVLLLGFTIPVQFHLIHVIGNDALDGIKWSPDNRTLAVWSSLGIRLLDTDAPDTPPLHLDGHKSSVNHIDFSPDGRFIASSNDFDPVIIWYAQTAEMVTQITEANGLIGFTSDGTALITEKPEESGLVVWSTQDWQIITRLEGSQHIRSTQILFSSDGKQMAVLFLSWRWAYANAVKIWDTTTWQELDIIPVTSIPRSTTSFRFSPDKQHIIFTTYESYDITVAIDSGEKVASQWETSTESDETLRYSAINHDETKLALSRDGKVIEIVDMRDNTNFTLPFIFDHPFSEVTFSDDGGLVGVLDSYQTLYLWTSDFELVNVFPLAENSTPWQERARHIRFTPDNNLIAYNNNMIQIWQPHTGTRLNEFRVTNSDYSRITFSPDRSIAAVLEWQREPDAMTIAYWDMNTGQKIGGLRGESGEQGANYVYDAAFSPDGRLIASAGHAAHLWDARTGQEVGWLRDYTFYEGEWQTGDVTFSPDGRWILVNTGFGSAAVYVWDVQRVLETYQLTRKDKIANTGSIVTQFYDQVSSMAFSPDGSLIALGSWGENNEIGLWNTTTWQQTISLIGHRNSVSSIAFSPDGKLLVSTGRDSTIRVWKKGRGL